MFDEEDQFNVAFSNLEFEFERLVYNDIDFSTDLFITKEIDDKVINKVNLGVIIGRRVLNDLST